MGTHIVTYALPGNVRKSVGPFMIFMTLSKKRANWSRNMAGRCRSILTTENTFNWGLVKFITGATDTGAITIKVAHCRVA